MVSDFLGAVITPTPPSFPKKKKKKNRIQTKRCIPRDFILTTGLLACLDPQDPYLILRLRWLKPFDFLRNSFLSSSLIFLSAPWERSNGQKHGLMKKWKGFCFLFFWASRPTEPQGFCFWKAKTQLSGKPNVNLSLESRFFPPCALLCFFLSLRCVCRLSVQVRPLEGGLMSWFNCLAPPNRCYCPVKTHFLSPVYKTDSCIYTKW